MQIIFIRHALTHGNRMRRYIGKRTNEPLSAEGIAQAKQLYSKLSLRPDVIFVSPMQRCQETAAILYPHREYTVVQGLEECDFGQFEGKSYHELQNNTDYQKWIDSGGTLPFPDGESLATFQKRCCQALQQAVDSHVFETAAVIAHGGTMMAVLSALEESQKPYFDWKISHCTPIVCSVIQRSPLLLRISAMLP